MGIGGGPGLVTLLGDAGEVLVGICGGEGRAIGGGVICLAAGGGATGG